MYSAFHMNYKNVFFKKLLVGLFAIILIFEPFASNVVYAQGASGAVEPTPREGASGGDVPSGGATGGGTPPESGTQEQEQQQEEDTKDGETPPESSEEEEEESEEENDDESTEEEGASGAVGPTTPSPASTSFSQPEVSEHDGSLVYTYSLGVPAGINGLTPNHNLVYKSTNRKVDNLFAFGWEIDIPYIERSKFEGSNNIYTQDRYFSSIDEELVKQTGNAYYPRIERGSFKKYEKIGDYWLVTAKDGTKYYFGQNSQARQDGQVDSATQIFKWLLEKIEDTNGNEIKYEYFKDGGQIYPNRINYVENGIRSYKYSVRFNRIDRTDKTKMYDKAFPVYTKYIINSIDFYDGNTKVFTYKQDLEFNTDPGRKHIIKALYKESVDDEGNAVAGPKTKFEYHTAPKFFDVDTSYQFQLAVGGNRAFLADINADGLLDGVSDYNAYLNTGKYINYIGGRFYSVVEMSGGSTLEPNRFGRLPILAYIDINGDYKQDLLTETSNNWRNLSSRLFISNLQNDKLSEVSGSYREFDFLHMPLSDLNYLDTKLLDLNGDSLIDKVPQGTHRSRGYTEDQLKVSLNNADGTFSKTDLFTTPRDEFREFDNSIVSGQYRTLFDNYRKYPYTPHAGSFSDINADGLPDGLYLKTRDNFTPEFYINNGREFESDSDLNNFSLYGTDGTSHGNSGGRHNPGYLTHDINNDGIVDSASGYHWYLGDGLGNFHYSNTYSIPNYTWAFYDSNNDGINDKGNISTYVDRASYGYRANFNGGGIQISKHNILEIKSITNPNGGKFNFEFSSAVDSSATNKTPFPMRVLRKISYEDQYSDNWEQSIDYEGGTYYIKSAFDKGFAGFASIEKKLGEKYEKKYYHQGNGTTISRETNDSFYKKGLPFKVETGDIDSSNNKRVLEKTTYTYGESDNGTNSKFVYVTEEKKERLKTSITRFGNKTVSKTSYTYDSYGNTSQIKNKDANSTLRTIDYTYTNDTTKYIVGNVLTETVKDTNSNVVGKNTYTYDTKGNTLTASELVSGTNNNRTLTYTYNSDGVVSSISDYLNNVTRYTYDSDSLNITRETNPLSHITNYEYGDKYNQLTKATYPTGFEVKYEYDDLGRLTTTKKKIGDDSVTTNEYAYDYDNFPTSTTTTTKLDGVDVVGYTYFDGSGNAIQERKTNGTRYNVENHVYTDNGLLKDIYVTYEEAGGAYKAIPNNSPKTTTDYDGINRITRVETPVGVTNYTYNGDTVEIVSPESRKKRLEHDDFGRLIKVSEYLTNSTIYTTKYTYDALDRLIKIEDTNGNIRTLTYDKAGRNLTISDLHHKNDSTYKILTYAYNNKHITSETKPDGTTISYTYDGLGRLLTDSSSTTTGVDYTYTYDTCDGTEYKGSLCKVVGLDGVTVAYKYDKEGNVLEETKTIDSTAYTTKYTYDLQNNQVTVTTPDGKVLSNVYGNNGRIKEVKANGKSVATFTYNRFNFLDIRTNANGSTEENYYDDLGRLTKKVIKNGGATAVRTITYTYDKVGNILTSKDTNADNQTLTKTYTYDKLNRLLTANAAGITGRTYSKTYTYDAIGNITSDGTSTYSYTTSDTTFNTPHTLVSRTTVSIIDRFTYDLNGNMLSGDGSTITWDYKNRVSSIVKNGKTYNYKYGYSGDRVKVADGTNTSLEINRNYVLENTTPQVYVFANGVVIGSISNSQDEENSCSLADGSSIINLSILSDLASQRHNIEGEVEIYLTATPSTILAKVAVNKENKLCAPSVDVKHIFTDILGSTIFALDKDNTVVESFDYEPYGKPVTITQVEGSDTTYKHAGNINDSTGFVYRGARYYSPTLYRFISKDPIVKLLGNPVLFEGSAGTDFETYLINPQLHNVYAYAANNPVANTDTRGLWIETFVDVAFVAVSAYTYFKNPTEENLGYLALDIGSIFIPFVPALGSAKRTIASVSTTSRGVSKAYTTYLVYDTELKRLAYPGQTGRPLIFRKKEHGRDKGYIEPRYEFLELGTFDTKTEVLWSEQKAINIFGLENLDNKRNAVAPVKFADSKYNLDKELKEIVDRLKKLKKQIEKIQAGKGTAKELLKDYR